MSSDPWRCNVAVRIELDPQRVAGHADCAAYGFDLNRQFVDLRGTNWTEARETLVDEQEVIRFVRQDVANGYRFAECFERAECEFRLQSELDLGVAAAVLMLNASGCPTLYSCNGHQTGYPYVVFWAHHEYLALLIAVARSSRVGIINGVDGCLEVFAGSRDGLLLFAEEISERSREFREIRRRTAERRRKGQQSPDHFECVPTSGSASSGH